MNDEAKVRAYILGDLLPGDKMDEPTSAALVAFESIVRESQRMESIVDSYVSMGPTNVECREMLVEALAEVARYEADWHRLGETLEKVNAIWRDEIATRESLSPSAGVDKP